ncbi:hypothetical protein QFX18_03750 [Saccharophagus degradans]|uniref:hypothetical protein n=1 Tax=Saccharophagus degradans TaxID=86304 RepID=UPI002477E10C|nr:hypothetical protein [Saccharophagus degradans]WGO99175.1 hypothetical protein QFX18_03750 [Saccharophagus degradans]
MNLDKSKKRIAKKVKMGFQGYPQIAIEYLGTSPNCANEVSIKFTLEEGAPVQEERFSNKDDVRENEVIQSAIVKMIERSEAKTVLQTAGVTQSQ